MKHQNELTARYGEGTVITVKTTQGAKYRGLMFGNDEMWDINDFYQLFLCNDKIYKCYYDTDACPMVDQLNYARPASMALADDYMSFYND